MSNINNNWFSINNDENIETEDISELKKRIDTCENTLKSLLDVLEELKDKVNKFIDDQEKLKLKVKENETSCNVIRNENLKLINRILEAEVSVERTTNILLRKHISFPFTPLISKLKL
jgi:predicted  nucleic acid-binding Zn-ribbon protein